jgi:FkbM family methyltransferase
LIECGGVWLPDGEQHMVEWMTKRNVRVNGKLTYQWHKQQATLRYCKEFRTFVDIGAHVGLWSMNLAPRFQFVYAFEPVSAHRECFARNVPFGNVIVEACALGETEGQVSIYSVPDSSGNSRVIGDGDIPLCTLDSYELTEVDLIKVDCEGYELMALKGAVETIKQWKPAICVEQKPGKGEQYGLGQTDAVKWLESLGAKCREEISGDFILTF